MGSEHGGGCPGHWHEAGYGGKNGPWGQKPRGHYCWAELHPSSQTLQGLGLLTYSRGEVGLAEQNYSHFLETRAEPS